MAVDRPCLTGDGQWIDLDRTPLTETCKEKTDRWVGIFTSIHVHHEVECILSEDGAIRSQPDEVSVYTTPIHHSSIFDIGPTSARVVVVFTGASNTLADLSAKARQTVASAFRGITAWMPGIRVWDDAHGALGETYGLDPATGTLTGRWIGVEGRTGHSTTADGQNQDQYALEDGEPCQTRSPDWSS